MDLRVLGPLEATAAGRQVDLGPVKQRALLVMLALRANTTVGVDELIEGMWGENPPASAPKMVQHYVSRLRKLLGGDETRIITHGRGYELRMPAEALDLAVVEALVERARDALRRGERSRAARDALAMWRGPPLADVAVEHFAAAEIRRLEELRLAALELAVETDLAAGRHRELIGELQRVVAEQPLSERLHAHRMLALYRAGRQADALDAYREARATLVEQVGVEPGPELQRLHAAILTQDPALELDEPAALPPEFEVAHSPLAGRDAELAWLRTAWRAASRGAGHLVLLGGDAGMGKTRLVAELAREVHDENARVLLAPADAPAGAARAALQRAVGASRPTLLVLEGVDRALGELVDAVVRALPALRGRSTLVIATYAGPPPSALMAAGDVRSLVLTPLAAEAVEAIVALYTDGATTGALPVKQLLAATGAVPARVHAAAAEWARAEATRQVATIARSTAAERSGLRALEDEMTGSVVNLQLVRERAGRADATGARSATDAAGPPLPVVCPFKGLASFDVADAPYFAGRDRLVAELVARLVGTPLLGIVGPSGSGKSSALRAGLLAALADGILPGSAHWTQVVLRPGRDPRRALATALADAGLARRLVIAVDQFEEVFTAGAANAEQEAFVAELVRLAGDDVTVVLAVRADFYGRCAAFPALARMLGAQQVLVGPLGREELRRAITLPAGRAGLRVDPPLVEALVDDVAGEPGALPLLSTALLELWHRRDGRRLTLSAYEAAGGVHGAVARLAESALAQLDADQQAVARRILLRLAAPGDDEAVVRRRVALDELDAERDPDVAHVLAVLTDDRLVIVDQGSVEVAHEALLREWPRLRGWLEEDAHGRRLHRHLADAAREWDDSGREPGELYRGARLAAIGDWADGHDAELNDRERAFLAESRAADQRETLEARRTARRLRTLLAGVGVLLLVAVAAGVLALVQRQEAEREATVADAQRLGAQALTVDGLDRSLLLARQGFALDDSVDSRSNLLAAVLRSPAAIGVMHGDGGRLLALDLNRDGGLLALGDNDGTVVVLDTATRRRVLHHQAPASIGGLAFSPGGDELAVSGATGFVHVLDVRSGAVRRRLPGLRPNSLSDVQYTPDGRALLAGWAEPQGEDAPGFVSRWDLSGAPASPRTVRAGRGGLPLVHLTREARRVVVVDGRGATIRDAVTLRRVRRLPARGLASALSADDRILATGRQDGSVRLLDLATGRERRASGRHGAAVQSAAFAPDGRTLLTTGDDGDVIAWDPRSATLRETLEGHSGRVTDVTIDADADTAYTTSLDASAIAWDLHGMRRLGRPFRVSRPFHDLRVAVSANLELLALQTAERRVELLDARTLRARGQLRVDGRAPISGLALAPDARLLAMTREDGEVGLWDVGRGTRAGPPIGRHGGPAFAPEFSADGATLATVGLDRTARIWDVRRRGARGRPFRFPRLAEDIGVSPDGRLVAVAVDAPSASDPDAYTIEILDADRRRRLARLRADGSWVTAFSRDGSRLVTGGYDGNARVWSTRDWTPVTRRLRASAGFVLSTPLSPDGTTLATSGTDGTVRLWDVASSKPIGAPLPGRANVWVVATFAPGADHLLAVDGEGHAVRWDVRPSAWAEHACQVAGRELSRAEWEEFLPGRDARRTCR